MSKSLGVACERGRSCSNSSVHIYCWKRTFRRAALPKQENVLFLNATISTVGCGPTPRNKSGHVLHPNGPAT